MSQIDFQSKYNIDININHVNNDLLSVSNIAKTNNERFKMKRRLLIEINQNQLENNLESTHILSNNNNSTNNTSENSNSNIKSEAISSNSNDSYDNIIMNDICNIRQKEENLVLNLVQLDNDTEMNNNAQFNIETNLNQRDQTLLQENNITMSMFDIVQTSSDKFNELVKSIKLTTNQLVIIKDIRRRGKNKLAAQICRKRKIDTIDSLKTDVDQLCRMKKTLDNQKEVFENEISKLSSNFDGEFNEFLKANYDPNNPVVIFLKQINQEIKQINSMKSNQNSEEIESCHLSSTSESYSDEESEEDEVENIQKIQKISNSNNDDHNHNNTPSNVRNCKHPFFIENLIFGEKCQA